MKRMFMKLSSLKTYQKYLLFFIITLLLCLPPAFVWFSINNLKIKIQDEKTTVIQNKLLKKYEALQQFSSQHYEIFRDFSVLFNEKKLQGTTRLTEKNLKAIVDIISNHLARLNQNYKLPVQASAFLQTKKGRQNFNFINDRKCKKNKISKLTQNLFKYYCIIRDKNKKKKTRQVLKDEFEKLKVNFNLESLNNSFKYVDYSFIRDGQNEKTLFYIRFSDSFFATALFDFSGLNEKKLAQIKINRYADSQTGIAFIGNEASNFSNIYSSRLKNRSYLVKLAIKKLGELPDKILSFKIKDEIFLVSPLSRQTNYRLILSSPAPELDKEPILTLLLALFVVIVLALWKTIAEYLFLNRKPKFSISVFVILLFLCVSILPMLSSIYLGSEFLISEFKKGKHISATNLEQHLTNLDIATQSNTRKTLNILKSLNTIESFKNFTGNHKEKDLNKLVKEALKKFILPNNRPLLKEVWIYNDQRKFQCYEWNGNRTKFRPTEVINPVIAENIRPRLNRYLEKMGSSDTSAVSNHNEIKMGELKLELVDQIFLYLFGQETYFKLKESIGILLKLKTFYDKNLFISIPVFDKGKFKLILTYVFTSPSIRNHFPVDKLSLKEFPKTFTLYGTSMFFSSRPENIEYVSKNYPEMLKIAKESNLTKYKLQNFVKTKNKTSLILAQPANYSDYILVGKKPLKSLENIKTSIVNKTTQFIAYSIVLLLLISFITSQYFLLPIKDLTNATRQIIDRNYKVRIAASHPDEFADMAQTFNTMARNLEEGKLLKSFVSKNVTGQLDEDQEQIKALRKNVTIAFCGLKNYSVNFKTENPEKMFNILQQLLEAASEAGEQFTGELDKMIDDKAMMVFEDLPEQEPSVDRAIKAVLQMQKKLKRQTGQSLASGINSGSVVAGVMGSEKVRLAYTVVGDPVNLAARLASIAAKEEGDALIISEIATKSSSLNLNLKKLDIETVKGKTQSVKIFRLNLKA